MVTFVTSDGEINLGDEISIETDGKSLIIYDNDMRISVETESVIETLKKVTWLMEHTRKTTFIVDDCIHVVEGICRN